MKIYRYKKLIPIFRDGKQNDWNIITRVRIKAIIVLPLDHS